MQLNKIYEDDQILVINKPSGLVVNNSQTSGEITLQNLIVDYIDSDEPEDPEGYETEFHSRGGIVHRLDKDTSGILLVAKNEQSFIDLQKQFKDREVEKEYIALVIGSIKDNFFEVDAPIARNPRFRMKHAVVSNGKEAITKFEKVKEVEVSGKIATLINAKPLTGRTHQIRVHLAAFDHPVVGDPIYDTRDQFEKWSADFNRLMLHARFINFVHPTTKQRVTFESPLPSEFVI